MQLIGSLTSPYVRKVRVVLAEKKLDCAWADENVWAQTFSSAQAQSSFFSASTTRTLRT